MDTKNVNLRGNGTMKAGYLQSLWTCLRFCLWGVVIALAVTFMVVDRQQLVDRIEFADAEYAKLHVQLNAAATNHGLLSEEIRRRDRAVDRYRELLELRMNSTENLKFRRIPMGRLGRLLGTVVKIDGQVPDEDYLMAKTPVSITHVNGRELETSVLMTVYGPKMEKGDRVSLYGYETGSMAGVPDALVERGYGRRLQSTQWHMSFKFVALENWSEEEKTDPPAEGLTSVPASHATGDRELSEDS